MSQLQDVSYNPDEQEFVRFRASVLTVLSARPQLRRLGVFLHGDDGLRHVAVEGVSSVLDLWSWLVANAPTLFREETQFAALIIPCSPAGTIHVLPDEAELPAFELEVWMADDCHRIESTGLRCAPGRSELVPLPFPANAFGPADAVAALLGRMLSEQRDPPPSPTRLLRPVRQQPLAASEIMAMAA